MWKYDRNSNARGHPLIDLARSIGMGDKQTVMANLNAIKGSEGPRALVTFRVSRFMIQSYKLMHAA